MTHRDRFVEMQESIAHRKMKAQRSAYGGVRWYVVARRDLGPFFPPFITDWEHQITRFKNLADSAAIALLGHRGEKGWSRWLEEIYSRPVLSAVIDGRENSVLGSVIKGIYCCRNAIRPDAMVQERIGNFYGFYRGIGIVTVTDILQGSILLCDLLPIHAPALDLTKLFTIAEAAKLLKLHDDTIRAMGKRGDLEIVSLGPRKQRIKGSEILRLRETAEYRERFSAKGE